MSSTIDTYSCPHCFESAPLTEAKNQCNHCFQCPQCTSTLSTYSIMVPSEVLGDQSPKKEHQPPQVQIQPPSTPPQPMASSSLGLSRTPVGLKSPGGTKLYYLSCTHCKWTTRDVGIRDKRSPMDFRERPSPHSERISELVAFYKEFGLRDKAEREKSGTLRAIVRNPPQSLEIRLCPQGPGVGEQGQENKCVTSSIADMKSNTAVRFVPLCVFCCSELWRRAYRY